jgi:outer membrane protein TolC
MYKILLFFSLGFLAYAQEVDFKTVLNQTLHNSKQIKQAKLDIQNSQLDQKSVQAAAFGNLYISHEITRTNHAGHVFNSKLSSREASFNDFGFNQMNQGNETQPINLNYPDDRTHHQSKIAYDVILFNGFQTLTQKQIAHLKQKAQHLHLNATTKELSFEVFKSYNAAVVAKEFIRAITKAQQSVQTVLELATTMHEEGLVTSLDVQEAKVQQLKIQTQYTQAHNQFNHALRVLQFLTSNEHISDVQSFATLKPAVKQIPLETLYEEALQHKESISMQHLNVKAMKENVKLQMANYFPNIYSHVEYGFNDEHTTLNEQKDYYLATIGIKVDLFHPNRNFQYQKAQIALQQKKLQLETQKEALKLQLSNALNDVQTKSTVLQQQKEAFELAQHIYDKSKQMYENRLIAISTLLQQEASLRQSQAALLQSMYEHSLAQAKLSLFLKEPFTHQFKKDIP